MKSHSLRVFPVAICFAVAAAAQQPLVPPDVKAAAERITTQQLKADLEFLASDELKGRNTPSPGLDMAAEYIATRLRKAGVKPLGDDGSYRQHYVMRETTLEAEGAAVRVGDNTFEFGEGFTIRTFAGELTTRAVQAVYVGHGWTTEAVDPYRGVDVKGKIVVVHGQDARPAGGSIRQIGRVSVGGTSPLVEAHRRGALAVAYLAPAPAAPSGRGRGTSRQAVRRELDPPVPSAYAAPPLTSIQLGDEATAALLKGTALDPARLAEQTKARAYPPSFELPATVTITLPAKTVVHRPFNVTGLVEGTDPALKNEYIVVETHLDGAVGTRPVEGDSIYNSADDNASGSAAGLAMAEQMARTPTRRSVIFMWDSGEEQGLWGTRRFAGQPPVPLDRIVALVNVDMIGANRAPGSADEKEDRVTGPNEVFLIGPGALSDRANTLIERVNDEYLDLSLNRRYDTPESEFFYPRTDAGPFLERGILTIGFTTGIHDRYHLPADEARHLDPEKMTAIARTVFVTVHALGRADERPRIEKPIPPTVLRVDEGTTGSEGEKLHALFRESDEANLRRNPIAAIFRGDLRYADRLGDFCSDAYYETEKTAARADLAALEKIDRSKLDDTDRIAYDVFKYQMEQTLAGFADEIFAVTVVQPVNHFTGLQTFYPTFASGRGAAPFRVLEDYENNLKRHGQLPPILECSIGRFRQGLESGVFATRLTIQNVIDQLDLQLGQKPEESPYYAPVLKFPNGFSETDRRRLRAAYLRAVSEEIYPAYRTLRDFLQKEYLPKAREGVGLVHMKGGLTLYDFLVESTTTTDMSAGEVHELGLKEVARIRSGMEAIKKEVGFTGALAEFFEHLRTGPKFKAPSAEWLRGRFQAIGRQVDERITAQFSTVPKSPLEIRPVEPFREKTAAGGSYVRGTPDGSRPGVFYFNTYDLPSRSIVGVETLYLHEGAPGHHFQISLAQENETLPAFMRFGGNTAYVEGWALYAETLGPELGLFKDPYQRFGHLDDEMLRAMRLVVDSGIHVKGWTRQQAIDYMLENSGMGRTDATAEVERYIAIPGQALAYKVGALTIQRLKAKAQQALGARFDPREFHAQVLSTGALPLRVLERKIDLWIESRQEQP